MTYPQNPPHQPQYGPPSAPLPPDSSGQPVFGQPGGYGQPGIPGQPGPQGPANPYAQTGYPAAGYPQPGQFAPPPPKKKTPVGLIIGIIAGALVLLCGGGIAIALVAGGNGTTGTGTQGNAGTAGLNQPVRDGKFEFTVTKVACGKTVEGDDILSKKPQGQYCEVTLTVKNIGTAPQLFDGSSQKAKGANGNSYGDDVEAEIYANDNDATFLDQINPGNTVTGVLIFDIPKDATIVSVELHDSSFSNGVVVKTA